MRLLFRTASFAALIASVALPTIGCGAGGMEKNVNTPGYAAVIVTQPLNQSVPIGQTATFSVAASGSLPLAYQWTKDGTSIPGATGTTYTTDAVSPGDSGSTFQVIVSNSLGTATSTAATLTAGPRSPRAGDLRYLQLEQVDLPGLVATVHTNIIDDSTDWFTDALGTPLELGGCAPNGGCAWFFTVFGLPAPMTGLKMEYTSGQYADFAADLKSISAQNVVVTSLDLEPANGAYAVSYVQAANSGGFDYKLEVVPPSEVASTAAADGAQSRIITAVSFDASGQANLISYGWQGDTSTVYETQTAMATADNVATVAASLASQGYIISASGGDLTNGYMVIGCRVKGDMLPRPVVVTTPAGTQLATNPDSSYFTTVVDVDGPSGYEIVTEQ